MGICAILRASPSPSAVVCADRHRVAIFLDLASSFRDGVFSTPYSLYGLGILYNDSDSSFLGAVDKIINIVSVFTRLRPDISLGVVGEAVIMLTVDDFQETVVGNRQYAFHIGGTSQ